MIRVTIQEFQRYTSKYMKGDYVTITRGRNREDAFVLCPVKDDISIKEKKPFIKRPNSIACYGCGCERKEGVYLCPKHGRM